MKKSKIYRKGVGIDAKRKVKCGVGFVFIILLSIFAMGNEAPGKTINLTDIPPGDYRWRDVADQLYSQGYRASYNYTQATVKITYDAVGISLRGTLEATNLKPNFAYQLKLAGSPGTTANEGIGLAGRWWQEEWNGSAWSSGQNLNNKGDGSSPSPNDTTYFQRRDIVNTTSPTGLQYRYTGYLVFDYFITDENGNAVLNFETNSSYHVLWKTSQRSATLSDGPVKSRSFDPYPSLAYDTDYPPQTVNIFGEWERLPVGGVHLQVGDYLAQIILTEESFHGSGGTYAGNWAAAMGGQIDFSLIIDSDGDGVLDNEDNCPNKPNGADLGTCSSTSDKPGVNCTSDTDCVIGCSVNGLCIKDQRDADSDGHGDVCDRCPNDANKTEPGICGCGIPDTDSDGDGIANCNDGCPNDPNKTAPGACGCGIPDTDSDSDGIADCNDSCPNDSNNDADADGRCADVDNCPTTCNPQQSDANGNGIGDLCDPNPGCGGCSGIQCEQACGT